MQGVAVRALRKDPKRARTLLRLIVLRRDQIGLRDRDPQQVAETDLRHAQVCVQGQSVPVAEIDPTLAIGPVMETALETATDQEVATDQVAETGPTLVIALIDQESGIARFAPIDLGMETVRKIQIARIDREAVIALNDRIDLEAVIALNVRTDLEEEIAPTGRIVQVAGTAPIDPTVLAMVIDRGTATGPGMEIVQAMAIDHCFRIDLTVDSTDPTDLGPATTDHHARIDPTGETVGKLVTITR